MSPPLSLVLLATLSYASLSHPLSPSPSSSSSLSSSDRWVISRGIDACPRAIVGHSELHSSTATFEECQAQCDANETCRVFSWNQVKSPHHCFWCYDANFSASPNSDCVSGCVSQGPRASVNCPSHSAPLPSWSGTLPSKTNKSAGLPLVPFAQHITVYNATLPDGSPNAVNGTYNHGPIITFLDGLFWMSWYNSPRDESLHMRTVYSTSLDGETWSVPEVLFENLTHNGEENGPWTILNGHLYTQSGSQDAGLHIPTIFGIMRRVSKTGLGEPFWLNETVPSCCTDFGFKTYLEMDSETRTDVEQFLRSAVRTMIGVPKEMEYNERSLYLLPNTRTAVNLLRGAPPNYLTAVTCELPEPVGGIAKDETSFSCRPGAGDVFYNLVEVAAKSNHTHSAVEPRTCNWSAPVVTSIPDSKSRTCAAPFPKSGDIYLVGNQLTWGSRDPVTIAVSKDGLVFDQHWAVRAGAPRVRWPGAAKGVGFQYPGAAVVGDEMFVSYSIGKEDIGLTRFPLHAINQPR